MSVMTCETRDGKLLTDGAVVKDLVLAHGNGERLVEWGTIRAFEQDGETRWEVMVNDPAHPAIGFLPENAITRSGK